MMKEWKNGDVGLKVRETITDNFKTLFGHLAHSVLALSKTEREALSDDYKSVGLIVYDTTLKSWYEWTLNGWAIWYPEGKATVRTISSGGWNNGTISIPYTSHLIKHPQVSLYMRSNQSYELVLGGVDVDAHGNITISSDLPFVGRIVIR